MRILHVRPDLLHQREDDQRRDRVADEGRDDEDHARENDQDAVQAHAFDAFRDFARDGVQQARGSDRFPEGEAAGGEDDDRPEEVVEIFFSEDAGAEEHHHRDDSHDAHIPEDAFELVRHAPECDCGEGDETDEVLHASETVVHGADGDDCGAFAGLEGDQEEDPD